LASFLSSFDSAFIASVHLLIICNLKEKKDIPRERILFYKYIGLVFILLNILFITLPGIGIKNCYFIANFLLGIYAIAASLLLATEGLKLEISKNSLIFFIIIATILWFIYLINFYNFFITPNIHQINTIPMAVFFLIINIIILKFLIKKHNPVK